MSSKDEVRAYLRNVDKVASKPVVLGNDGRRLLTVAENRLSALGAMRWESVGSSLCGTSVAGFSDVDMLAVFLDPIRHWTDRSVLPFSIEELHRALERGMPPPAVRDAGSAFDLVRECLDGLGPSCGFDLPVGEFPTVYFSSRTGEPSVEVVPSMEADVLWDSASTVPSSGLVRVAFPARRERWLGTEPRLHSSVLDLARHGTDYSVRELIRLLKLIKYRRGVPVLSYFLELFAMRWLEGSETIAAESIASIVEQYGTAWSFRPLGILVDDIAELVASLAGQLRKAANGDSLTMIDLTTPETNGTVDACEEANKAHVAADLMGSIASEVHDARLAARTGNSASAIAQWRAILGEE